MKSKIINRKPIDYNCVIEVDDIQIDPKNIENHRQRINTIFANKPEEYRLEQINKMIMHDILFSKAMDYLNTFYEFEIDQDEQAQYEKMITSEWTKNNVPLEEQNLELAKIGANKIIIQQLIFNDIQSENNITVSDDELEKILIEYYQNTNQPIRPFKQDLAGYENARQSIIHEKTIAHILGMFKFNLDKFNQRLEEFAKTNK